MSLHTIKKSTATKFLSLMFALGYGVFVTLYLQKLFLTGSGDIISYVLFFEDLSNFTNLNQNSLKGDGVFRLFVYFLGDYFNLDPLIVLSFIAFVISSIVFFIFLVNIRSTKYLIYILPLFLIVFFTPMVTTLFASGIRSGVAFTILLVAIINYKGATRNILFGLSSILHYSMIPIISLYSLFYFLRKTSLKSPFIVPLFLVLLSSISVVVSAYVLKFNITPVNSSLYYNFLIFYVGLLIVFINKNAIKNIYGFISIGLILIYLIGLILDISFIRYVGNSIILYLFFLIVKGEAKTIQVFTTGYAPFLILTLFYSFANQL